jgi:hypothetical protein
MQQKENWRTEAEKMKDEAKREAPAGVRID